MAAQAQPAVDCRAGAGGESRAIQRALELHRAGIVEACEAEGRRSKAARITGIGREQGLWRRAIGGQSATASTEDVVALRQLDITEGAVATAIDVDTEDAALGGIDTPTAIVVGAVVDDDMPNCVHADAVGGVAASRSRRK